MCKKRTGQSCNSRWK